MPSKSLIIGAGAGLSASLAHALADRGHQVILAARDTSDLSGLAEATGASAGRLRRERPRRNGRSV